jgi:hypothetical protein
MNLDNTKDGLNFAYAPGVRIVGYRAKYAGVLLGYHLQPVATSTVSTPSLQFSFMSFLDGPKALVLGLEIALWSFVVRFEFNLMVGAKDADKRAALVAEHKKHVEALFAAAGQPPVDAGIIRG